MEIKKTIILVRHGTTDANEQGFWQGRGDNPLNPRGRRDAESAAERLREESFDVIYHSPMSRARETAEIIGRYHGAEFRVIDVFVEIDVGEYEGLTQEYILKNHMDAYRRWSLDNDFSVPGGESYNQVFDRVRPGAEEVLNSSFRKVLVVGHAMVNRTILGNILGMSRDVSRKFRMKNGALSRLLVYDTPDGNHIVVETWNDTAHLTVSPA